MTVGELINVLKDFDPELKVVAESQFGEHFEVARVWQIDRNSYDTPKKNNYLTIEIFEL